jgi:hypothetical protein
MSGASGINLNSPLCMISYYASEIGRKVWFHLDKS